MTRERVHCHRHRPGHENECTVTGIGCHRSPVAHGHSVTTHPPPSSSPYRFAPDQHSMKPSKPFIISLAFVTAIGVSVMLGAPRARAAEVSHSMPLSTKLTPAMVDYFALDVAFERPSIASLVACAATPACGASDSSRVRFIDALGVPIGTYDGAPSTTIEQIRWLRSSDTVGVTVTRTLVRRWVKDDRGRVVMNGSDLIVRIDVGAAGREPSTLTRLHRYSDLRYVVNDPTLLWPITGMAVLELSNVLGATPRVPTAPAIHAAVSYDGSPFAHIATTNGLAHRVNLPAKVLETTMPDR
jgi:hypothetical protein